MKRLKRSLRREDGMALATVVMMIAVLSLLSIVLIDQVTSESNRAAGAVTSDAVYQAAEAGINDYIAKLTEDSSYYDHYVANGESPRKRSDTGAIVDPGSEWTSGVYWTYPSSTGCLDGKCTWYQGASFGSTRLGGFAYNLMVSPQSVASKTDLVTIVSTGCKLVDPNAATPVCDTNVPRRAIETQVTRATSAKFQVLMNDSTVCYASITYGKMLSLKDLCHYGTAYGDLLAEGSVVGSGGITVTRPTLNGNQAQIYDSSGHYLNIDDKIKPGSVSFPSMAKAVTKIQAAAAYNVPSTDFETAMSNASWRIVFDATGNVRVWLCTGSSKPEQTAPTCPTTPQYNGPMPANGAIFTNKTAIISWSKCTGAGTCPSSITSTVSGRVTVASANNIVVAGDIKYASETAGNRDDDLLGLIAQNNVWIATYASNQLTWRAATMTVTGKWGDYDCESPSWYRGDTSSMTFIGAAAYMNSGGCMRSYSPTGGYNINNVTRIPDDGSAKVMNPDYAKYDVLDFLDPPWFEPFDNGLEATVLYREVVSSFTPPVVTG